MAARQIYDPEGFRNIETDGRITGYQFRFKAQYYRGITLSIIRDIQINIDGEYCKKGRYPFYGKWGDIYHGGDADGY